jgi:two-component system, response regulator
LLGVDLTGVSGLEVLENGRSDERTELLPIILCSASTRLGDAIEGYKLGANSYVTKLACFTEFSEAMRLPGWY